jgi:DNA polymerase I
METAVWDVKSQFEKYRDTQVFDSMIAEFLLSYGRSVVDADTVLKRYKVATLEELAEKQKNALKTLPRIRELFEGIEMPLASVLWQMEQNGILLDVACLKQVGEELKAEIIKLEDVIKKEVGFDINLQSSIQVGNYLAEKAGVPLAKTKTGRFATNEAELAQYIDQFPIIERLLTYRELTKLQSTYVESLITKVDVAERVHTTYHQVAVNTGRLASSNPNMQNIPVSSAYGLKIKSCFIAPKGRTLLSFDYSQQELRILAHLTSEEKLIEAFQNNRDVHKLTASRLFNVSYDDVNKQQRSAAKTVNFGIVYGMSSFGLSAGLRISEEEARQFIKTFYEIYPKIKTYYDAYLKQGKIDGYVETLLGRRRYVFDYPGQKFIDNSMRRVLINYPIQGSAADLMKKAMVEIDREILKKDESVKLLLQIHDDLVFEVKDDEKYVSEIITKIKDIMCNVYTLTVPIEVDVKRGRKWGEMKEL